MRRRVSVMTVMLMAELIAPRVVAGQGLPSAPVLPASLAMRAAGAAVEACAAQGYRETVVVVDADGVARATLRGDGAGPHTLDSAFRKAYTAASFRMATTSLADRAAGSPELNGLRVIDHVIFAGGGLPIRAGEALLGGIGAAGAPGFDKDDACAKAGLDAIAAALR
jgi:uncharacterized protein GlcG (DUF336 family)